MSYQKTTNFICEEDYPVVESQAGKLRGYVDGDVFCFRGIEYARAERFHMPEPVEHWEGIKDATNYGCGCPELTYSLRGKKPMMELMIPQRFWHLSEDCQNLNVWTKSIEPGAKRPVMVWFHGGGFAGGSSIQLYSYNGWELSHEYDVVVVTVNHRLNMLGFLDLSEYGEQYCHSGNLGMADLVASLEWVRDNIAYFGGDPENVTIFGQSGGGGKVTTLMQMPAADGLYHRAIIQSGVMKMGPDSSRAKELSAEVVKRLGLAAESIGQIEDVDYEVLAATVRQILEEQNQSWMGGWAPVADGSYYVGSPFDVGFRQETKHIPLIVGSCVAEFDPIPAGRKENWSEERKNEILVKRFGEGAGQVKEAFQKAYPELDWSYAAAADGHVRPAVLEFLNLRNEMAEAPVYNYVFAFESPILGGQLTGHNGDLHFMFHNAIYMEGMFKPEITGRIQDEMAGAWAQFAYAGNPNRSGLPMWPHYTKENGACIVYGDETKVKEHHDEALLKELEKYPARLPH